MDEQNNSPEISYDVRVKPGRAGTDPEAPDWEVVELEDGVIKNSADSYDNMTPAEAKQSLECGDAKTDEAESVKPIRALRRDWLVGYACCAAYQVIADKQNASTDDQRRQDTGDRQIKRNGHINY